MVDYNNYLTPTNDSTNTTANDFFDFPLDIKPMSYSGIGQSYQDQLMQSLMPQLQQGIANMPQNIDNYTQQAYRGYQEQLNNALRQNIPKAISGLSNRGILSSTQGNEVLSKVINDALLTNQNKGYETAMLASQMKANMPALLNQIASNAGSQSYSEDPTVMYQTMANLINSMM